MALAPHSVDEIARAVAACAGTISIGGGRYSMGGQTATSDGLQLDPREFEGVVAPDILPHAPSRCIRDVQTRREVP